MKKRKLSDHEIDGPESLEIQLHLPENIMVKGQEHFSRKSVGPSARGSLDEIRRCIEMFFYRTGMDSVNLSNGSFMGMTAAILGVELSEISVPSCHDLRGPLLQRELKRIELRVKEIKSSWKTTGCSVLVDGWRDDKGRDLMNVIVDCPQGQIYLKSLDISAAMGDFDAVLMVFGEIIEEVGADNVVQIISNYTSPFMKIVGKLWMEKHPTIYWTVSSSHCLEIMLENIGTMDAVKPILNNARSITKFIYNRPSVLMLMRSLTSSSELVKSSKFKSTMPFITLENIVSEKKNLEKMFSSSEWRSSVWSSSTDGRKIAVLVRDSSFWTEAEEVLKATLPLVRALHLIDESPEPQVGFIYETMDQVKETIKYELKAEKARYMPYWKTIDKVWNNWLHSNLHSAAYFLNPRFGYSTDFHPDNEVYNGLFSCIVDMVEDRKLKRLIMKQVRLYDKGEGTFGCEDAAQRALTISSVNWWSFYAKEWPELQSFAIRILSQTCDGASKYDLDKSLAERLLTEGRNGVDQQLFKDLTICHYNIQLEEFVPGQSNKYCKIDPMNDWIVDETLDQALLNSEPTWMELAGIHRATTRDGEGTSRSAQ